jgi:hypothetical protein
MNKNSEIHLHYGTRTFIFEMRMLFTENGGRNILLSGGGGVGETAIHADR